MKNLTEEEKEALFITGKVMIVMILLFVFLELTTM